MEHIIGFINLLNEYSTLILSIINIIFVVLIYRTFRLTKKDSEVRNRPYISASEVNSAPVGDNQFNYDIVIENRGKTPGKTQLIKVNISKFDSQSEKFLEPLYSQSHSQKMILLPNQTMISQVSVLNEPEKVGLKVEIVYSSFIYRKKYRTKLYYKLERGKVIPLRSFAI